VDMVVGGRNKREGCMNNNMALLGYGECFCLGSEQVTDQL